MLKYMKGICAGVLLFLSAQAAFAALPSDERIYVPAATMLTRMGIKRVRLMTNNPEKISQLERYGIEVAERVAHSFPANGHNENYLRTKAERAGHLL